MNKYLNRQLLAALCATPLLLGASQTFADEAPAADAAPAAADAAPAAAEAAPAAPAAPYNLAFNLGLYSAYMFRGVDLSAGPALQGGIDFSHTATGLYVGTWWSNIDRDFTGKGDGFSKGNTLETDWYFGWAHTFDSGFGVNLLGNWYYYPNRQRAFSLNGDGQIQDSFEMSAALSYKYFTYTFYYMPTDYYGAAASGTKDLTSDTSGATYNELKVNYPLPFGGLNMLAKVGYQRTPNLAGSEGDYAIGVSKDFALPSGGKPIDGFNAGVTFTNTFKVENQGFYTTNDGRDANERKVWFYLKRTW